MITEETMEKANTLYMATDDESTETTEFWTALVNLTEVMHRQGRDLFSDDVAHVVDYEHQCLVESRTAYREPNILTDHGKEIEVCDDRKVWITGILIGQHTSPCIPEEKWVVYLKGIEGLSGGRTLFQYPYARIVIN